MKENQDSTSFPNNFAVLAIGNMGKTARLSLASLLQTNPASVCCLSDNLGTKWIKEVSHNFPICFHDLSSDSESLIGTSFNYESLKTFGAEDFVKLTPLKWDLIKSCLERHSSFPGIMFTDLDVLWRNSYPRFSSMHSGNDISVYAQNDYFRFSKRPHYCTGIMFWPNTSANKSFLLQLSMSHKKSIADGDLTPDEPKFNAFITENDSQKHVKALPRDQYVIGHRLLELLLSRKLRKLDLKAFHANYLYGDKEKFLALKSIQWKLRSNPYWITKIPFFVVKKFLRKYGLMNA